MLDDSTSGHENVIMNACLLTWDGAHMVFRTVTHAWIYELLSLKAAVWCKHIIYSKAQALLSFHGELNACTFFPPQFLWTGFGFIYFTWEVYVCAVWHDFMSRLASVPLACNSTQFSHSTFLSSVLLEKWSVFLGFTPAVAVRKIETVVC